MSHYGNLIPENDLASNIDFVPENNLVSKNEAYRSHLINHPNIINEPYDPYTS